MSLRFATLGGVLDVAPPDLFAAAAQLGFNGVELDWHELSEAEPGGLYEPEARDAMHAEAQKANVEIHCVAAHFLNNGNLNASDEATRAQTRHAIEVGIELCRDLGATALLVPFFGTATLKLEQFAGLSEELKPLARGAATAGVTLCLESTLPAPQIVELCESINSPNVAAYWDMGNAMCWGLDPISEIQTLRRHIGRVHAKEFFRASGAPKAWQDSDYSGLNAKALGQGSVPVREVIRALREAGYNGYITLETGAFGDRLESARAALKVLKDAQ